MEKLQSLDNIGLSSSGVKDFRYQLEIGNVLSDTFYENKYIENVEILCASSIQNKTFDGCSNLTSITFPPIEYFDPNFFESNKPENIQKIIFQEGTKDISFILSGLKKLNYLKIPSTVKSFEQEAFNYCYSLENLYFNDDVKLQINQFSTLSNLYNLSFCLQEDLNNNINLGLYGISQNSNISVKINCNDVVLNYELFQNCPAKKIVFLTDNDDYKISKIQDYSFSNCSNLISLDLQNSKITEVNIGTFENCYNLMSVILPNTVTALYENCFKNITYKNNYFELPENLNTIYNTGIIKFNIKTIPVSLEYIADYSFKSANIDLKTFALPNIAYYIGSYAFANTDIINISQIGSSNNIMLLPYAFANCTQLTSIDFSHITQICEGALSSTSLNSSPDNPIFLKKILQIQKYAFANIQSNLYLDINKNTFKDDSFELSVFENSCLKRLVIDNMTVKEFNDNLSSLVNKSLLPEDYSPEKVIPVYNIIKNELFCSSTDFQLVLEDFVYDKDGKEAFYQCLKYDDEDKTILTSCDKTIYDYSRFITNPILNSTTLSIMDGVFSNNNDISTINLKNTVFIGKNSFNNCDNLSSISSDIVKTIAQSAFESCDNLKEVIFNNVKNIEKMAFKNNSKLSSISFNTVSSISQEAFYGCNNIISVDFPLVSEIEDNIFTGTSISSLRLQNVKNIPYKFLTNSPDLKEVYLDSAQKIESNAFIEVEQLSLINIPNIQDIKTNAFSKCNCLLSQEFPSTLSLLESNIFDNCQNLKKIVFNGNINKDNFGEAFKNLDLLDLSIYIPYQQLNDIEEYLKTNPLKTPNETPYITFDKNNIYPSFITYSANSNIKVINGLIVDQHTHYILSSQDIYLKENTTLDDFEISSFEKVKTGAFYNTSLITLVIPESWRQDQNLWTNKFESNPFNGDVFQTIKVNDNYSYEKDHLAWNYLFSKCKEDGGSPIIYFNDGWLNADDHFVFYNDPFIYDSHFNIIDINESKVLDSTQIISSFVNGICSNAFKHTSLVKKIVVDSEGRDPTSTFKIYDNAFEQNYSILSFEFNNCPNVILEPSAFFKSNLVNLKLPASSEEISGYGLNQSSNLQNLEYSEGIKRISPSSMINYESYLSSIKFPTTLLSIGEYAFASMINSFPSLCSINFEECENLERIEKYAFYNSLKTTTNNKLIFPQKLTSIDDATFAYKKRNLESHTISSVELQHIYEIGASAFLYNAFKQVDFGEYISSIGDYAFANSQYKYPIHLPSTISSIGQLSFKNNIILNPDNVNANIISIDLPFTEVLKVIGLSGGEEGRSINSKFQGTNYLGLTQNTIISATNQGSNGNFYKDFIFVTVNKNNLLDKILNVCPNKTNINILTKTMVSVDTDANEIFIPQYIKNFQISCFNNCSVLEKVNDYYDSEYIYFNNPVSYLFNNCQKISNIKILSSTTDIGEYAFQNCQMIEHIQDQDIQDNIQYYQLSSIKQNAFSNCVRLKEFTIPASIKIIQGSDVFMNCSQLSSIDIMMNDEEFKDTLISNGDYKYPTVKDVIIAKFENIRSDGNCRIQFLNSIYSNNGDVKIDNEYLKLYTYQEGALVLSGLSGLSFTEPYDVRNQSYLNISAISRINSYVFDDFSTLKNIGFLSSESQSLTSIGDYTFYNCQNLATISNNKLLTVKQIGEYTFGKCSQLTSMTFDLDLIENIGKSAFYKSGLKKLIFNTSKNKSDYDNVLQILQNVIGYESGTGKDRNPLELPESCNIIINFNDGISQFNYLLDDTSSSIIDINRHIPIFVDKTTQSIKPLILVESSEENSIPAIVANTFHANVIGRWK